MTLFLALFAVLGVCMIACGVVFTTALMRIKPTVLPDYETYLRRRDK